MLIGSGIDADQTAQFAREVWDFTQKGMPEEKAKMVRDMDQTGKELKERGSDWVNGRGQAIASIPPRIYMRWAQEVRGCWQDKQFVDEFLFDNPQCCAVGYKPRPNQLRKGFTFIGGASAQSLYQQHKTKVNAAP